MTFLIELLFACVLFTLFVFLMFKDTMKKSDFCEPNDGLLKWNNLLFKTILIWIVYYLIVSCHQKRQTARYGRH